MGTTNYVENCSERGPGETVPYLNTDNLYSSLEVSRACGYYSKLHTSILDATIISMTCLNTKTYIISVITSLILT